MLKSGKVYWCLAHLELFTPLLLATCTLHPKGPLNTCHMLGSETRFVP